MVLGRALEEPGGRRYEPTHAQPSRAVRSNVTERRRANDLTNASAAWKPPPKRHRAPTQRRAARRGATRKRSRRYQGSGDVSDCGAQ